MCIYIYIYCRVPAKVAPSQRNSQCPPEHATAPFMAANARMIRDGHVASKALKRPP